MAQTRLDPKAQKTIMTVAAVEAVILMAGVGAYVATDQMLYLMAAVIVGGGMMAFTLLRLSMTGRLKGGKTPTTRNIVE